MMDCFFEYLWDYWQNWNWSEVVVVISTATLMKGNNFSIDWVLVLIARTSWWYKLGGLAISAAASLSKPGGKLSNPVAFFRFSFFSSRSTNIVDTYPNWKVCWVLCFTTVGGFQINSRSLKVVCFNFIAIDEKNSQKALVFLKLLSAGTPTRNFLDGKIDLIACQNFLGLFLFSVRSDWW